MLPSSSPTASPTMEAYNQTYSRPSQQVPLSPMSIVDIFFPGLTNISAAFQHLQTSNTNGYVRILCICGIIGFLGKYAYNFVQAFVENHFSSLLPESTVTLSDRQQLPQSTSLIPMKHTTCLSPGYPTSHLLTRQLPPSLAWAGEEECSPIIRQMGARRKLFSIRLGMEASFSGTRTICSPFGVCRMIVASTQKKKSLSPV